MPDTAIDTTAPTLDSWLHDRQSLIGASESPAILGCGYSGENAWTVWARKRGLAESTPDNEAMECGRILQPAIIELFRRRTGLPVIELGEFALQRHAVLPWMGCTLDGLIEETPDGKAVVEVKNVNVFAAGDWKSDEPPLRHNVQAQHQMEVTGAQVAYVVGLIGGNRLALKKVPRNQRFIDAMLPHLAAFWRLVEEGIPPPIDNSGATAAALKRMYPKDNSQAISLGEEFQEHFAELVEIKAVQSSLKRRREFIENTIKAALGPNESAVLPDGSSFTWTTEHNRGYTVAPHDKRVLRQRVAKAPPAFDRHIRVAHATAALIAAGATLYDTSRSGSRYFELAGGLRVRVSDHEANEATEGWIERQEVAEVRVDRADWRDQLAAVVGPDGSEEE